MSDTVLHTFVVLYNIWKSVRGFTAQQHVQWILSTSVSEGELKTTLTFNSFLNYSKIANFCSFITISLYLNCHRMRMNPSLEMDFVRVHYPIQTQKTIVSTTVDGFPGVFVLGKWCCNLTYQSFPSLTQFTENYHLVIISSVTRLQDSI